MLGGVKAVILLLALVLIAGGAASSSTTDKHPEHVPYQHRHDSHPSHHQAPPLLEMLPPIGPIGFVLMGVMGDYYLSRYDHNGHGDDHNGHGDDHNGHGDDHNGHHSMVAKATAKTTGRPRGGFLIQATLITSRLR
jgi:hypothetical protein